MALAQKCDQAFPEKGGWFSDWYRESQSGTAQDMAEQIGHLLNVASLPNVTLQILPAIAHAASASGLII